MFKQSFFLVLLIISLFSGVLFLSSCYPSSPYAPGYNELPGFVGGTIGLAVNVLDGAPPSVIQDYGLTPFSFVISLENAGEALVGPGTDNPLILARLAGIPHKNFGLTQESAAQVLDHVLEPAKRNFDDSITPGEISYISFDNLVYKPDVFESLALTIRAEVCYDYETYATAQFCMKKDVFDSFQDASICTLKGYKPVGNSGAPLHITAVWEAPINEKTVQLNFVIEHLANGVFFYRSAYTDLWDACVIDDMNPDIYKIEVFVEPVQDNAYSLDCFRLDNPLPGGGVSGSVRMYRGAPITINCFLTRQTSTNVRIYQDLINIKLRYRYAEFLDVPILVQGHP
ncbi:hypothetical protein AYK26_03410 [Euryarchaeota archaeon SM23-78]|nr:MAG: hypothetical protein AYK26_03410 [Euryarchaeota archaeon SM23-78]MBW3001091.1 hypothetical protein [Candidatus Woesearchaeota archaeon]